MEFQEGGRLVSFEVHAEERCNGYAMMTEENADNVGQAYLARTQATIAHLQNAIVAFKREGRCACATTAAAPVLPMLSPALVAVQALLNELESSVSAEVEVAKSCAFTALLEELLAGSCGEDNVELHEEDELSHRGFFLLHLCHINSAVILSEVSPTASSSCAVPALLSPASSVQIAMGHALDTLSWVVHYACYGGGSKSTTKVNFVEALDAPDGHERSTLTPSPLATDDGPLRQLLAYSDALVALFETCLTAVSPDTPEMSVCGAASRLNILCMLDMLLRQCLHRVQLPPLEPPMSRQEYDALLPRPNASDGTVITALEIAMRLGRRITSDALLSAVAAQLLRPVPVLDEIRSTTGVPHTVLYDCLRHGIIPARVESALTNSSATCTATRPGGSTRRNGARSAGKISVHSGREPQSPLEFYICAVACLRHATNLRAAFHALQTACFASFAENGGSGTSSTFALPVEPPLCVWKALVCTLERALQEGESALMAPPTPPSTLSVGAAAVAGEKIATEVVNSSTERRLRGMALAASATAGTSPLPFDKRYLPYTVDPSPRGSPVLSTCQRDTTSVGPEGHLESPLGGIASPKSLEFPAPLPPYEEGAGEVRVSECHEQGNSSDAGYTGMDEGMRSIDDTAAGVTDADIVSLPGHGAPSTERLRLCMDTAAMLTSCPSVYASQLTQPMSVTSATMPTTAALLSPSSSGRGPQCSSESGLAVDQQPLPPSLAHRSRGQLPVFSRGLNIAITAVASSSSPAHGVVSSAQRPTAMAVSVSSKSSCLPRERREKAVSATLASSATVLRWITPSHARLTIDVLALLSFVTTAPAPTMSTMQLLVEAGVLTVLSELLECPGSTMRERVMKTLENCFAYWEKVMTHTPEKLMPSAVSFVDEGRLSPGQQKDVRSCPIPSHFSVSHIGSHAPAPRSPRLGALHTFLQIFSSFLGWDAEGWEVTHSRYTGRAMQLLIQAIHYAKYGEVERDGIGRARPSPSHPTHDSEALTYIIAHLLQHGVVAHVWRCLSIDAIKIPGMIAATTPSTTTAAAPVEPHANAKVSCPFSEAAGTSARWMSGGHLYYSPLVPSPAIMSEAQCTAMELLGTLAESLDWAARAFPVNAAGTFSSPLRPQGSARTGQTVPSFEMYSCFMEELFLHLPACANCLRRCTYTRSSSWPLTTPELNALCRILHVLRVLFTSMGPASPGSPCTTATTAGRSVYDCISGVPSFWLPLQLTSEGTTDGARLRSWASQIDESRVLDVLAHIGTAAELAGCRLPRLSLFTLRSYLEHVHVLSLPSPTARRRSAVAAAALHALVHVPLTPPGEPGVFLGGTSTSRECLLVTLLSRMNRRSAGVSGEVLMPIRLEVFALLVDVLLRAVRALRALTTTAVRKEATVHDADIVRTTYRIVTIVVECQVWSGTIQELRYLGPDNAAFVKESLRLLCQVSQLLDTTAIYWRSVTTAAAPSALATLPDDDHCDDGVARDNVGESAPQVAVDLEGKSSADRLSQGQLMATALMHESACLSLGFDAVTMGLPLTLAGLVNGTRWHTTNGTHVSGTTGCTSGGISPAPSAADTATDAGGGTMRYRMTPCPPSARAASVEASEFADEDRRETFHIAACALAQLLRRMRYLHALVLSTPASLSYTTAAAAAARSSLLFVPPTSGGSRAALLTSPTLSTPQSYGQRYAGGAPRSPSLLAATPMTDAEESVGVLHHQRQHDIIVVFGPGERTGSVITTTVYPTSMAAENEMRDAEEAASSSATQSLAARMERTAAGGPTVAPSAVISSNPRDASRTVPPTHPRDSPGGSEGNGTNWRESESLWRQRALCLRTAYNDAVRSLQLSVLDRFLNLQRQCDSREYSAAKEAAVSEDAAAAVLNRENEDVLTLTAVEYLASEKKLFLTNV